MSWPHPFSRHRILLSRTEYKCVCVDVREEHEIVFVVGGLGVVQFCPSQKYNFPSSNSRFLTEEQN